MGKKRRRQPLETDSRGGDQASATASEPTSSASSSSSKRQATDGPLTARELEAFIRDGFVLLKDAFAEDTAAKCRELVWRRLEQDGICKSDPSTWVERHGIAEIYNGADDPIWDDVLTPKLHRAVDQLCGAGAWEKFGCGWWMVTFPNQSEPPWDAAGKWHVDGASYQHHIDSRESGLLAIFCFSDIAPTEGGTALSAGSHAPIARLLEKNEPRGLRGGAVSFTARKFPRDRVVEVNGKAGDVMLVHPFLLHARSKNLGQKRADSVRIMCNPNIRLRRKMNLNREDSAYTPVEQAIVNALKTRQ